MRVEIGASDFLVDGEPAKLLSGAMHYFRIHPGEWRDRLAWARHMGLDTIETYVPWNLHNPAPDELDFTGGLDLEAFLGQVAEAGLRAIVRPGPYICTEMDLGGLPAWLLADREMRLRSGDERYLAQVGRWFDELLPRLAPLQAGRGGPIVLVQVENEYGAYGAETAYLDRLVQLVTKHAIDVPLVTSDQPYEAMMSTGAHPSALRTANFGSDPDRAIAMLRRFQPAGPLMCMEFWNGWFDHWGEAHHTRAAADVAGVLDEMLQRGASVNFYMFCGGTNFGFMNGANFEDGYRPTVTSYDSDAPLSEDGRPTEKFWAYREVIARYRAVPPGGAAPRVESLLEPQQVACSAGPTLVELAELLADPVEAELPITMEELDQSFGFQLYDLGELGAGEHSIELGQPADRAILLLDDREVAVLDRESGRGTATLKVATPPVGSTGSRLRVLLENQGRINYGPQLADRKGLGSVTIDRLPVRVATVHRLPLDSAQLDALLAMGNLEAAAGGPRFFTGSFEVAAPAAAWVALPTGHKGVVWVNGFNLGRYWDRGPQRTLYLPGPVLRPGPNTMTVLELHPGHASSALAEQVVELTDRPDLG
jgi:beta-galactosidase